MEDGLVPEDALRIASKFGVLILVVMEDGLVHNETYDTPVVSES